MKPWSITWRTLLCTVALVLVYFAGNSWKNGNIKEFILLMAIVAGIISTQIASFVIYDQDDDEDREGMTKSTHIGLIGVYVTVLGFIIWITSGISINTNYSDIGVPLTSLQSMPIKY
jgi:hypothetical protein